MALLGGLGRWLGGHGRAIIAGLQEIGQTVASALRLGRVAGVDVEPAAVVREWGEVLAAGERKELFASLHPDESPPVEWYEMTDVPWKMPLAYTVAAYGRNLATGQFTHQEYWLTFSRPLTSEEILDETRARFGSTGKYPLMDIFSMKLVGGARREGEEWRW